MKIVLLKDVAKLGKKHDAKTVSDGYALNFLIPNGSAIAATKDALKRAETDRARQEGEKKVYTELLAENVKRLSDVTLTIVGKANDKGHLFAGLHREEIAKELNSQTQIQIDAASIQLEHPLKEVGEYTIELKTDNKSAKFKVVVKSS